MESIFDYLKRKDLVPITEPNETDLYLFSMLSYAKFEKAIKMGIKTITLSNLSHIYLATPIRKGATSKNMAQFVALIGKNPRYKGLKITHLKSLIDREKEIQFAALTVLLPNGNVFISYRGTDETLVAWKEDANLSFLETVPSQILAEEYLREVAAKHPEAKIYIGGHSKGGSLAVYAAATTTEEVSNRIEYILDADSPGQRDYILSSRGYKLVLPRIHSFIPEYDIVGLIFRKKGRINVISSSRKGAWQHYYMSWNIDGDHLQRIKEIESGEQLDEGSFNSIMSKLTNKQLRDYVETVYALIKEEGEVINLVDLMRIKSLLRINQRFSSLPKEKKDEVRRISVLLFQSIVFNRR